MKSQAIEKLLEINLYRQEKENTWWFSLIVIRRQVPKRL